MVIDIVMYVYAVDEFLFWVSAISKVNGGIHVNDYDWSLTRRESTVLILIEGFLG